MVGKSGMVQSAVGREVRALPIFIAKLKRIIVRPVAKACGLSKAPVPFDHSNCGNRDVEGQIHLGVAA